MKKRNWPNFLRFWFPVIGYSGIIFYVSSIPNVKTPLPEWHFDLFLHLLIYIPFGFFLARGVCYTKESVSVVALMGAILLVSFFYGMSDEFHQSFVPGRSASVMDAMADTIGGAIGGLLYASLSGHLKRR